MKVLGVVEIERREQRENIGLDAGNEDLERRDRYHQREAGNADNGAPQQARIGARNDKARKHFQQHVAGQGSAFTKAFPPTGVLLPRLGRVTGSAEAAERDETLRYMFLRGIQLVRGWRYVRVDLPQEDLDDAERNIRELYDLCRRCGHPGHFITGCKASFDRLGRPC